MQEFNKEFNKDSTHYFKLGNIKILWLKELKLLDNKVITLNRTEKPNIFIPALINILKRIN